MKTIKIIKTTAFFIFCMIVTNITFAQKNQSTTVLEDPSHLFPAIDNPIDAHPSPLWGNINKPYPTNAWFINFALNSGDGNAPGSNPVVPFPYQVSVDDAGLYVSYTQPNLIREPYHNNLSFAQIYPFVKQMQLGTVEREESVKRFIDSYTPLSVTMKWQLDKDRGMSAPIVRGSPYVTMFYDKLTPEITPHIALHSVNGQTQQGVIPKGKKFIIVLGVDQANTQTWIMYSQSDISFTWKAIPTGATLIANNPYTGWIRLVLQKDTKGNIDNSMDVLDRFAQTIPTGASIYESVQKNQGSISFDWQTQNGQAPLLVTLPHQRKVLSNPSLINAVKYKHIKGEMIAIVNKKWEMIYQLPIINLFDTDKIAKERSEAILTALKGKHQNEGDAAKTKFVSDGPYGTGKRLARAARLALIANQLNEHEISDQLVKEIEKFITKWMCEDTPWQLSYDKTWSGIIPKKDDFGATHYNDHHFHYGYWLYAFSIIAKFDPDWLHASVANKKFTPFDWASTLLRDYANRTNDAYFPRLRYQDDYDGHSWASGLVSSLDGQNQESISEAINAYYSLALFGQVTGDESLQNWGRLLLERELQAAETYWQITKDNKIYLPEFVRDNQIVGNVWSDKVDAHTFFGNCEKEYRCGLEYSFGIQMLPFTPATPLLLNNAWSKEIYTTLQDIMANKIPEGGLPWKWILLKGAGFGATPAEREILWNQVVASDPATYDNGDSKTNTLYVLAKHF